MGGEKGALAGAQRKMQTGQARAGTGCVLEARGVRKFKETGSWGQVHGRSDEIRDREMTLGLAILRSPSDLL